MLLANGRTEVPGIDASYAEDWLFHPAFGVFSVEFSGGTLDEAVLGPRAIRRQSSTRPCVGLFAVTSGELLMRRAGRAWIVRAGEAAIVTGADAAMRIEPAKGEPCRFVTLSWIVGADAAVGHEWGALGPRATQAITALATTMRGGGRALAADATVDAFAALRAAGVPVAEVSPREIRAPQPEVFQQLIGAFSRAASHPGSSRGITDLVEATGRSPRQVARLLADLHARYGMGGRGFRESMLRSRVHLGSMFLGAPGGTTEAVGRLLGYSDPTSYCRLHASLGLPSPGEFARALRTAT